MHPKQQNKILLRVSEFEIRYCYQNFLSYFNGIFFYFVIQILVHILSITYRFLWIIVNPLQKWSKSRRKDCSTSFFPYVHNLKSILWELAFCQTYNIMSPCLPQEKFHEEIKVSTVLPMWLQLYLIIYLKIVYWKLYI